MGRIPEEDGGSPLTDAAIVNDPYAKAGSRIRVFSSDVAMSRAPSTDKSFTYFALLDAFDKHGCPLCRCLAEYSQSYLDTLFYEQVNDVGLRRKLRASRGFCNWHAWQARQIASSALGVAILANDLIREEMTRLDDLLRGPMSTPLPQPVRRRLAPKFIRAFMRGWQQKKLCPACQILLDHERHALETMVNFIHDRDFAQRFERCAPLCILHTTRVVQSQGQHPGLRRLIELQRHKYAHLVDELEEFCRKHDYRSARESWGTESDSWLRAIELLAGKPEVFGNDIYRRQLSGGATRGWDTWGDWLRGWLLGGTSRAPDRPRTATGETLQSGRHPERLDSGRKE